MTTLKTVNMTLSKRGDYVVRSALCLARATSDGEGRKIREVVAEMDVPKTFASQILADLVRAGITTSKAGKEGGYRLTRPPSEITLLEVVEAGEGNLRSDRCALGEGPCRWESVCPLHETWTSATSALREVLAETSLEEVLERDRQLARGEAVIPADSHRPASARAPVWDVSDSVQVEKSRPELLAALGHELLVAEAISEAYEEVEELRRSLEPAGVSWRAADRSAQPATSVGRREQPVSLDGQRGRRSSPGRKADGVAGARDLAWDLAHPGGSSSRFEGTLTTVALDSDRSELRLDGRFRSPAPAIRDGGMDSAFTERLVRTTARTFLRRLARALEAESTVSAAAMSGGSR